MAALIATKPNVRAQSGDSPFVAATGMWTTQPHYVIEMYVKRGGGHGMQLLTAGTEEIMRGPHVATGLDHTASIM